MFILIYWFETAATFAALSWVFWRAYLVLAKPVDELVSLLGLEVPAAPQVSLADVKSNGIILHWKPPDQRNAVVKYQIQCNGAIIGEVLQQETSVVVERLRADHFYTIRVISVNTASFQAASPPIRLKTKHAASGDCFTTTPDGKAIDTQDSSCCLPSVRPYKPFLESSSSAAAPPMVRESSASQLATRRAPSGRRASPATPGAEHHPTSADQYFEGEGTVRQLTEMLEDLRKNNEELGRQLADEEEQFEHAKAALSKERDDLRQSLKDREDVTKDLRKQVGNLERANAASQNRKSQQERALQSKRGQRERMSEDMARWDRETREMRSQIERLEENCMLHREAADGQIARLRETQDHELQAIKLVEEDVRQRGIQVKELEAVKQVESETEEDINEHKRIEAEEDNDWVEKFRGLELRYKAAWSKVQQARGTLAEANRQLKILNVRHSGQANVYTSPSALEGNVVRPATQHIRRYPSVRHDTSSSTGSAFPAADTRHPFGPSLDSGVLTMSPTPSTPSSYFGNLNGTGVERTREQNGIFPEQVGVMSGGVPMSPTAGTLIPSDLLGDEADVNNGATVEVYGGGLDPTSLFSDAGPLPGLGAPQTLDQAGLGPNSPSPLGSRSPSLFSSPRESVGNLQHHFHQTSDSFNDSDRRSIRSTSGSFRSTGPPASKFASIFGMNRARGKTLSEDSPALGSLKGGQTQSMPRSSEDTQDLSGAPRRRTSHSGSMLSSVWSRGNGNPSSTNSDIESPEDASKMPPTRRNPFSLFSPRRNLWSTPAMDAERSSSPRPASTYSMENALPRPSTELGTQPFGWGMSDSTLNRPGAFGAEWSYAPTSSWSHHPSRRPSVQYGSGSLSHDLPLLEGDSTELGAENIAPQPPIGTKPKPRSPSPQQKLNPAAKDFKSFFSYKKSDKTEKPTGKGKGKEDSGADSSVEGTSPPDSRKSKDKKSGSGFLSDSGETLERLEFGTASDTQPSASGAKAFMSKMSRKGSSGKFSLPSFKDKGLFSKRGGENGTPDETDEDASSLGKLSRSFESLSSSPQVGTSKGGALSWGSFRKKGKKGESTPSISETSMASEAGLEEEDEGDGGFG